MSRSVTALYDSRAEAEAARQRLSSTVDVERVNIIDQNSGGSGSSGGFNDAYISNEDRHAYREGIRRGGFLLCAKVDSHEDADRIVRALEETSSVDLDQRQESWRSEGWTPYQAGSGAGAASLQSAQSGQSQQFSASSGAGTGQTSQTGSGRVVEEEHIPIVEEELRIGKREVERGGARVRSYVREVPVHEQVTLREEHVSVERRPVDQKLERGEIDRNVDLMRDRTIEMTEHAEEAVVGKEARVREEVVLRKTAEEHVEQIDDTVRRTEVDVEEGGGRGDRSAFGGFGDGNRSGESGSTGGSGSDRDRSR